MKIVLKTNSMNEPRFLPSDLPALTRLGFISSDLDNIEWMDIAMGQAICAIDWEFVDSCGIASNMIQESEHISYEPTDEDELTIGGMRNKALCGRFTFVLRRKMYATSIVSHIDNSIVEEQYCIDLV